jgi:MFS family permease
MRSEKYVLRLYPRAWRQRYEEEVLAMLELHPCSFLESVDLFFGALDAHLHPHLGTTGLSLYERMKQMLSLLRRSLLTIFCASIVFILAGVGFQKMNEYNDFQAAVQTYSIVGLSFHLVVIGAFVIFLAVLGGGLPIASAIISSALTQKRYGSLFLLATPFLAFTMFLGTTLLLEAILKPGNHLSPGWHMFLERGVFLGVLIAAAIASTGAMCFAVARSEISEDLLRFALLLSIPATLSMALILVTMLVWGLNLHSSVPQLFNSSDGMFGSSTPGTWLGTIIAMAITTVIAVVSLVRGLSARTALRRTAA